ncbi:hypothetical protein P3T36_001496 [Kitasatospora sp. MAP12-15]|uniref:DUF4190 domain-containing protein n=1 Tax=unclassified Kitasatospora TaxID=2633591 RepID=UPI002475DBD9|nr:DUF4190 domain-containing protein [Kitasatospora sp. MAP12-44]MDH6112614.1 hypothetical protein [Kitasatospora sp. MAP12-44]
MTAAGGDGGTEGTEGAEEAVVAPPPVDPWAPPSALSHPTPQAAAPYPAAPPYPAPPYAGSPYPTGPYPTGPYPPPNGPYSPGPYGAWSGLPAPRPSVNGFAIASLVTALACFLWPLALGFGITGLVQIPRRHQRGTGLAVSGMVLSVLGLFATIGVVAGGLHSGSPFQAFGGTSPVSLQLGQCFNRASSQVDVVSCDLPHDGEVVGGTQLEDSDYPSQAQREQEVGQTCVQLAGDYAMDNWAIPSAVLVHYFYPQQGDWAAGERRVSCFLTEPDQKLTGSLRKDSSNTTSAQYAYLWAMDAIDEQAGKRPSGSVADDPASFRSWATAMATTVESETNALAGDTWDPGAMEAIAAQIAELKLRIPALRAAGASTDTNELIAQLAEADQHRAYDQQKAVRQLLQLSTDESWATGPDPSGDSSQSV